MPSSVASGTLCIFLQAWTIVIFFIKDSVPNTRRKCFTYFGNFIRIFKFKSITNLMQKFSVYYPDICL
jgi:hypothetical protein